MTSSGMIILYVKHGTVININKSVNYFKQKYQVSLTVKTSLTFTKLLKPTKNSSPWILLIQRRNRTHTGRAKKVTPRKNSMSLEL